MAAITRQEIPDSSVVLSYDNADTGAGDTVSNPNSDTLLLFKNPGASQAIITVAAQITSGQTSIGSNTKANSVLTLEAGEDGSLVCPAGFNDGSENVNIAYSGAGAADVDVAALVLRKY